MLLYLGGLLGAPASASPVRPASVEVVPRPPGALHTPFDGRLNGDGFTAQVTGYRFGDQFGTASGTRRAAAGQVLLVFGVTSSTTAVSARLVFDGHAEALGGEAGYSPIRPTYYLASVPVTAADVALAISKNGFTQEFSFTKGRREGLQPSVLYESTTSWELTQQLVGLATLSVRGPGGVRASSQQPLLISVHLTYFLPGSNEIPAGPSKAWLVLQGSTIPYFASTEQGVPGFSYSRPMAGSDVSLTIRGGPSLAAKTAGSQSAGLFDSAYYWQVPAALTQATIKMSLPPLAPSGPGSVAAAPAFSATASAAPLQVSFPGAEPVLAPTSQPLGTAGTNASALPGPVPTSGGAAPGGVAAPAATGRRGADATRGAGRHASAPVTWWLFVLAFLAVVLGGALLRRRRSPHGPALAGRRARSGRSKAQRADAASAPEGPAGAASKIATSTGAQSTTTAVGVSDLDSRRPFMALHACKFTRVMSYGYSYRRHLDHGGDWGVSLRSVSLR